MKKHICIFVSILLIGILPSCNDKPDKEFFLPDTQKSLLPYKGGDYINFRPSDGTDIISYTALAPQTKYIENSHEYSAFYIFENLFQQLNYENGKLEFYMNANQPPLTTQFMFYWKNDFEGFPMVGNTIWLPVDSTEDETIEILGDMTVNNNTYHDVFVAGLSFPSSYNDTVFTGLSYPLSFYFSPGYGIIRMDMSDSTYLELVGKE